MQSTSQLFKSLLKLKMYTLSVLFEVFTSFLDAGGKSQWAVQYIHNHLNNLGFSRDLFKAFIEFHTLAQTLLSFN